MIFYLLEWFFPNETIGELKEKYFSEVKRIFKQFDHSDYEVLHEGLDLYNNIDEDWLSKP